MHPAKKEKSNNMLTTFLVTEVEHYIELVFCLFSFWQETIRFLVTVRDNIKQFGMCSNNLKFHS